METNRTIIVSLGGSLIIPDEIDTTFLSAFKALILSHVANGTRFVLITGGGKICRRYQSALKEIAQPTNDDLDWMGISTTRTNAMLVKLLFKEYAHDEIVLDPTWARNVSEPIIIGAGWKPGWSTDYDAVEMAITTGAKQVINLSNIDYAYDSDPKKNPNAKRLEKTTWAEYRSLIPKDWDAGLSTPFDPIASKRAEEAGLEVAILNGANLQNLESYLNGGEFIGTTIQ